MDHIPWYHRIGVRVAALITIILLFITVITAALIFRGFQQTEEAVSEQSIQTAFSREEIRLVELIQSEAQLNDILLREAAALTQYSATALEQSYLSAPDLRTTQELEDLEQAPSGVLYDASADRLSDIVIFANMTLTPDIERNHQYSRILDLLFTGELDATTDVVALYYIGTQGYTRYAPPINLHEVIPPTFPVTQELFFAVAAPGANPERLTAWTPPYEDPAGNGLLISVSTPVYENDTFRGVIGADLSLEQLITRVESFEPVAGSFAFIVDNQNRFVGGSDRSIEVLLQSDNAAQLSLQEVLGRPIIAMNSRSFEEALREIRAGSIGTQQVTIDDQAYLMAYAPIQTVEWRLVIAVPVETILAGTNTIVDTIQSGTDETLSTTLLILGLLMLAVLLVTFLAAQRFTKPLIKLAQATSGVIAGGTDIKLDERSSSELGVVARSFNHMVEQLNTAQARLKQVNQNLETTIQERTQELETERATLQQTLQDLQSMTTTVSRLTTPIIPVLQGVVVVPIIGTLDSDRLKRMEDHVLEEVVRQHAHTVIMDVTGLDTLASEDATRFSETIEALFLLGAQPILVGVHPDVAQNLILSNIDLQELQTMPDLQAAINTVIRKRSRL